MIEYRGNKETNNENVKLIINQPFETYEQTMYFYCLEQSERRSGQIHHDGASCQLFSLCER